MACHLLMLSKNFTSWISTFILSGDLEDRAFVEKIFYQRIWWHMTYDMQLHGRISGIQIFAFITGSNCFAHLYVCVICMYVLKLWHPFYSHQLLTDLLSVSIIRCCSISKWCSPLEATWCSWSDNFKRIIWDIGAYITIPCEF